MTLSIPLMGADFFDGFYDSNYYFGFCFSGFQYALAVYPLRPALHRIWFVRNGENNENASKRWQQERQCGKMTDVCISYNFATVRQRIACHVLDT